MTAPQAVAIQDSKRTLPDGWGWVRLGEVCEMRKGHTPREEWYAESGCRLVRFRDLKDGCVDWTAGFRSFVSPQYARFLQPLTARSTLVTSDAHDPASIGKKIAYVEVMPETLGAVYYSGEVIAVRPSDESLIEPRWPFLWLSSEAGYAEIQAHVDGVHLNSGPARDILIPLPPLPEQKHIAAILNEQMAAVKQARAAAEAQLETTKTLPAAYLRAVFNSPEAQQWPRKRLAELCEIVARQVDPKLPEYGALPHVNGENIEGGICRLSYLNTAAQEGMTSGKYLFDAGDVLYSKLRPYLRKVVVVDFRGVCSADMYPIRVNRDLLDPHFTAWMLVSDEFTRYADEESRRARMPKLNRDQLFAWNAPLPPLFEQQRIVLCLSDQMAAAERTRKVLQEQLDTINKLPAALLRRAFSGEL